MSAGDKLTKAALDSSEALYDASVAAPEPPPLPSLLAAPSPPLSSAEKALIAAVRQGRSWSHALLESAVNINSGSHNKAGLAEVQTLFGRELEALTFAQRGARRSRSFRRYAWPHRRGTPPRVLLLGHVDTVFEPAAGFERARRSGGRLHGPGVADMKGGVVAAVTALRGLAQVGLLERCAPTVLLTSDEEIGAPGSRSEIARAARQHDLGLVLEPGRPGSPPALVVARPGAASATLTVRGAAAHSGSRFLDGINAVDDLARKIVALARLTDLERGLSVNPGTVESGPASKHNRIPDLARAELDLRFRDLAGAELLRGALDQLGLPPLVRNPWRRASTSCALRWDLHCPPMPFTPRRGRLFSQVAGLARHLGTPLAATGASGGSDANTAAAEGLLLLDGLGPVGAGFHTREEWVDLKSLVDRACLLALLLHRLATGTLRLPR